MVCFESEDVFAGFGLLFILQYLLRFLRLGGAINFQIVI